MKKFILNSLWIGVDKAVSLLGAFFITILIARYLGPENMGIFNFVLAVTAILAPICQLGADHIVFNRVAKNKRSGWLLIDNTKYLRAALYFLSFIVIMIYVYNRDYSSEERTIFILLLISGFFSSQDLYRIYFNGALKSKINSTSSQISLYISLLIRFVLVKLSATTVLFAIPFILSTAISYFIRRYFFYKESIGPRLNRGAVTRYSKYYLSTGLPLMISGLSIVIYTRISQVILGEYVNVSSVAIFNASLKISQVWMFIPLAVITSLLTKVISEKQVKNKEKGFSFLLLVTSFLSIPIILMIVIFHDEIILYTYGNDYIEASEFLIILSISSLFSLIGTVSVKAMIAYGARKYLMFKMLSMAIINIVLCLYLIPLYGIYGAAISVLLTEIISATLGNYFYKNSLLLRIQSRSFLSLNYISRIAK